MKKNLLFTMISACMIAFSANVSAAIEDSLIAYFDFQEVTASNTIESTASFGDVPLSGYIYGEGITLDAGPEGYGNALYFDGASYISFDDTEADDVFDLSVYGKVTLACWTRFDNFDNSDHQNLLSRGDYSYTLKKGKDNVYEFFIHDGSNWHSLQTAPPSAMDSETWVHFAGTFDGNTLRIYADGVEISTLDKPGLVLQQVTDVHFTMASDASNGNGRNFAGTMDEAYIFGRALSAEEIEHLMLYGLEDAPESINEVVAERMLTVSYDSDAIIVSLKGNNSGLQYDIFNACGQLVKSYNNVSNRLEINSSDFVSGMYIVSVVVDNQRLTKKVVVK